jgi:spermidine synthase
LLESAGLASPEFAVIAPAARPPLHLPLVLALFVGSGAAALIYQIVWFQLLQLVIGSSAISLGILLGTFMGGMCLGSLGLARVISARHHPLRVYALLELGIAAFGILVLFLIPLVADAYLLVGGRGIDGIFFRSVLCAICLLPPTVLMGATLPAISRWVQSTPSGVAWLGYFYGGNTAGAVLGCLLAGFYLLRVYDMPTATWVAVALNVVVAVIGLGLAASTRYVPVAAPGAAKGPLAASGHRAVYFATALSGMTALGAEVIWTRELSLLLGGTTYTFSIILAVFLIGIGLGSSVASLWARSLARPRLALGICQLLLVAGVAWSAYAISQSLPYWPVVPDIVSSPWVQFQLDLVRSIYAILPAACLWGASFPLALAVVASDQEDAARVVGGVYAANTLGAIIGALLFSIVLLPLFGTHGSQRLMILLTTLAAALVLAPMARSPHSLLALAGAGLLAVSLSWTIVPLPFEMIAFGRQTAVRLGTVNELYRGEGMNSSIGVSGPANQQGVRSFHVAGKIEASSAPVDMRLQLQLGNLPALLHGEPESVLVVGFGAGVTAGSFVPYPSVQRLVICEIEPLIPTVVSRFFAYENQGVVDDPRVEIVLDDARHFIHTTDEKFDIITSDPIHPWVKGAASLYTREYFEKVKARLKPGGIVTQWVPLYESSDAVIKSEIATFLEVFPNATVWGNPLDGSGYDVVLLGSVEPATIDIDGIDARLTRADHARVLAALTAVGFASAHDLLATFAGSAGDLAPWLVGAEINRDRNLRLQYLAGMSLTMRGGGEIYNSIRSFRRFPEELFIGSTERKDALRNSIMDRATP